MTAPRDHFYQAKIPPPVWLGKSFTEVETPTEYPSTLSTSSNCNHSLKVIDEQRNVLQVLFYKPVFAKLWLLVVLSYGEKTKWCFGVQLPLKTSSIAPNAEIRAISPVALAQNGNSE